MSRNLPFDTLNTLHIFGIDNSKNDIRVRTKTKRKKIRKNK